MKHKIEDFIHCKTCMRNIPANESPQSYRRYDVGFMTNGDVQVWCTRCDKEVVCFPAFKEKVYATTDDTSNDKYDWGV